MLCPTYNHLNHSADFVSVLFFCSCHIGSLFPSLTVIDLFLLRTLVLEMAKKNHLLMVESASSTCASNDSLFGLALLFTIIPATKVLR